MRKSSITATFEADVKTIWNIVTDNNNFLWRSDLANIGQEFLMKRKMVERRLILQKNCTLRTQLWKYYHTCLWIWRRCKKLISMICEKNWSKEMYISKIDNEIESYCKELGCEMVSTFQEPITLKAKKIGLSALF